MRSSAAQKMSRMALPLVEDAPAPITSEPQVSPGVTPTADVFDDGLPPPTKAQAFFWAQVCGAIRDTGVGGVPDGAWPPDLGVDRQDLQQMVERGLLAKRRGAWRLRRGWYARLDALKARAVPTPVLQPVERPAPDCPTYAELEAYERVCRWLDARPSARSRLPFTGLAALGAEDEEPLDALRAMRRLRLVRHTGRCEWALSPTWRSRLLEVHQGMARALLKIDPSMGGTDAPAPAPSSLCAGLDTWGLNWLVEAKTLPPSLRMELDDYQRAAQGLEREVETRWVYDGVALRIYQAGVRAKGGEGKRSKGVSWSYILVNPSLRLLIRRTPLGGIVANARLGSECLWRRTPLAALNELHALVRRMWRREEGHWQVSYAHLAHDVANAPLELEQLDRYVSRSRKRALFDAAQAETERLRRELRAKRGGDDGGDVSLDDLDWDVFPLVDWEAEYGEDEVLLTADPFAEDGYEWDTTPARGTQEAQAALEEPVEKRAITVHRWGTRVSGVAFSQGGPVSFVMYRKDWEGRLKNKRHMEPLWTAAGWDGKAPVTRHEARLIREPLRELRTAGGAGAESQRAILDDPWEFLAHEHDVWGSVVGRAEACPSAVDVAWIRRVVPREGESNRSRWDTDPAWRVVQRATFGASPLAARRLVRQEQRQHDLEQIDQQLLGLLKTREAILHADPTGRDLSVALRDVLRPLERELARRGEDFGQAARLRRRDRGLPVGLPGKVLPFHPRREDAAVEAERARACELDAAIDALDRVPGAIVSTASTTTERNGRRVAPQAAEQTLEESQPAKDGDTVGRVQTWAWLRARSAETRMREAFAAFEAAEVAGRSRRELEWLAARFEQAAAAHAAAEARLRRLDATPGPSTTSTGTQTEVRGERHG